MPESIRKVVIVGGVAGGATVAARLRRLDESLEIVLLERGEYISFANCGLPYHIGGVIPERGHLLVQTAEGMRDRYNIDVRVFNEVVSIDRANKQVKVRDLKNGNTYFERYDVLILSPGAAPLRPRIPGIDSPRVLTLRNMADMDRIMNSLSARGQLHVVVVGGGFIGLEMAENLHKKGNAVTIVEMADQVMTNLDREMAAIVHNHIRDQGVGLVLSDGVAGFEDRGETTVVRLQSGQEIEAGLVILAIGVRPESALARDAGLQIGPRGGILVGPQFNTSDPYIYAIGDAAEFSIGDGKSSWVPLAGPANRQARLLADHLKGRKVEYRGAQGTAIAKVFDLVVASTGMNERTARQEGVPVLSSVTHSNSHAGYYPGASMLAIKLVFQPDGKLLGAQVVGRDGVDKRIDVLATALRFGANVRDLASLELAYAPPFGSAKDPINIAGYVASNIIDGDMGVIYWNEVSKLDPEKSLLLDVREIAEWDAGHIQGAIHIPLNQLRSRLHELPKDKEIIVYCRVGQRAWLAMRILAQNGFKVRNLCGGWLTYQPVVEDFRRMGQPGIASGGDGGRHPEGAGTSRSAGGGTGAPSADEGTAAPSAPADAAPPRTTGKTLKLDCTGLQCPGPIMQVYKAMQQLENGDILDVTASDPGFLHDVGAWAERTGNTLLSKAVEGKLVKARIMKGSTTPDEVSAPQVAGNDKTIVVFSGDLDKALAAFVIANGAAAMGRKVTMFFTFWGLNVLRRPSPVPVNKGLLDRMFGMMMPRGSTRLGLSRMNMGGLGPLLIRSVMRSKGVASLEDAIAQARAHGVRLVACQMSMDVMGIKKEELIDGVEIGGVATYLAAAEKSDTNLFI